MARIYWTEEEKTAVARQSFELRRNNVVLKDFEIVQAAQEAVLPPDRHRPMKNTIGHMAFITLAWSEYQFMMKDGLELPPLPEPYVAPLPETETESTDAAPESYDGPVLSQMRGESYAQSFVAPVVNPSVEREHLKEFEITPPMIPLVTPASELSTAELITELMVRMSQMLDPAALRKQMLDVANEAITARVSALVLIEQPQAQASAEVVTDVVVKPPKHNPEQQSTREKPVYKKVMVLGLREPQKELMRREFPGIDFYFKTGYEGSKSIRNQHEAMDLSIQTQWAGSINAHGWKNYFNAAGLDGIRRHLKEQFNMIPLR